MFGGIMAGHEANQQIVEFIKGIVAEIGKEKIPFESNDPDPAVFEAVKAFAIERCARRWTPTTSVSATSGCCRSTTKCTRSSTKQYPDRTAMIDDCMYKLQKYVVRRWLLDDGKRVDGRGIDEDPPAGGRGRHSAPRTRLGPVYPRPDAGAHHRDPRFLR